MAQAIITVQGGPDSLPTLLGQAPARIPTGGKIRPGIMVLTPKGVVSRYFYGIEYGGSPAENEYVLTVRCSKGTYIRTLLEEIAAAMGQKGTMSALRRTAAGLYTEADAHTLEEILAAKEQGTAALEALMLPVESVFTPLPLLVVEPWVEQHLYNGCPTSRYPAADGRYRVRNAAGQFLGLANITGGVLRVEKLFVERN